MNLTQAIEAAGMTPPHRIVSDRWMRFPGVGKPRSNRAGWCRLITPTLAIYGDWSSDLIATWRDETHHDSETSARLLEQARLRSRAFAAEQQQRQSKAAIEAERIIHASVLGQHSYLQRKGFVDMLGLVHDGKLVVPVRNASRYTQVISVQLIAEGGEKRFLPGGRTRCGIYRIGVAPSCARRVLLCEGYATGLSLHLALQRLPGPHAVVVCFSAGNLELVAESFSAGVVCADNDESQTGEKSARATGLKWSMPPDVGTDFNDMHQQHGLLAVTEALRAMF